MYVDSNSYSYAYSYEIMLLPGDRGVWLGEEPLAGAPGVAEDRGAAGLLVGLHSAEALTGRPRGGVAQHQEVHPDVGGPPVPLIHGES